MANNVTIDWRSSLVETYTTFSQKVVEHIPQILGALLLLIVGWILAAILRLLTRKVFAWLDRLLARTARVKGLRPASFGAYGQVAGTVVFWSILLFFLTAAANSLELALFYEFSRSLMAYLPNLFAGLLIILAGFALSGITHSAVLGAASSTGIARGEILARVAQTTVILTAIVIGAEQLGINVAFITNILVVTAGVLLFGTVLAFGLGARHFVANIIGARTAQKVLQVGDVVRIADTNGRLLEITQTSLVLDSEAGRIILPASLVHESPVTVVGQNGEPSSFIGNLFHRKSDSQE